MPRLSAALLSLVCIAACAAKPKTVARVAPPPPPPPTLRSKLDGPAVAYAIPEGWRVMRPEKEAEPIVMVHPGSNDEAASILLQEASLDDKLEEVTRLWLAMATTMLKSFHPTDWEVPKYPSDGESSFIVYGVDEDKHLLALICRIKQVGSVAADYWAVVILTGRAENRSYLTDVGDRIVNSLHIQPQSTPK